MKQKACKLKRTYVITQTLIIIILSLSYNGQHSVLYLITTATAIIITIFVTPGHLHLHICLHHMLIRSNSNNVDYHNRNNHYGNYHRYLLYFLSTIMIIWHCQHHSCIISISHDKRQQSRPSGEQGKGPSTRKFMGRSGFGQFSGAEFKDCWYTDLGSGLQPHFHYWLSRSGESDHYIILKQNVGEIFVNKDAFCYFVLPNERQDAMLYQWPWFTVTFSRWNGPIW